MQGGRQATRVQVDEIKALFTTKQNVYRTSLGGALAGTMSTIGFTPEPTGVSYNPADGHLFYSDDDARRTYEVNPGSDGALGTGDDTVTPFDVAAFGSLDPEDVNYDLITPGLWIIDGCTYDVSAANAIKLAGVVMAPGSTTAGVTNFYLVDRAVDNNADPRENDGRMYEFTREKPAHPAPTPSPTPTSPPTPPPTPPPPTPPPPTPTTPPSVEPAANDVLWLP